MDKAVAVARVSNGSYWQVAVRDYPTEIKSRYIFEHRFLAEKVLGRPLLENEIAHHIDGDTSNNSLDNICVLTKAEKRALERSEFPILFRCFCGTKFTRSFSKYKDSLNHYCSVDCRRVARSSNWEKESEVLTLSLEPVIRPLSEIVPKGFNLSKCYDLPRKAKAKLRTCPVCRGPVKDSETCSVECRSIKRMVFNPSKEELEKYISELPMTKIGLIYGVSDNAVRKRCRKLGIYIKPTKPRGTTLTSNY